MVMIEAIEAETGVPIAEQFDLIAGTSIGGCGALVRAQPAPLVYSLNRRSAIAQFDYPKRRLTDCKSIPQLRLSPVLPARHRTILPDASPSR